MNLVNLPLADVKPYWRNPRISEPAVESVKKSIERYGFNVPLVLDTDHVIIAGHTRYRALMELGHASAPCVVLDLPKQKAKEYRIADNKTAEFAQWNLEQLLPELREIKDIGEMQVYFPEYDLAQLLEDAAGSTYEPPSQDSIDQANSDMQEMFEQRSLATRADYVAVTCPHCHVGFHLSKDEINRQEALAEPV